MSARLPMQLQLWTCVLAQVVHAPTAFNQSDGSFWGLFRLGVLSAGMAIGVLAYWYIARVSGATSALRHAPTTSPQQLFHELCRAHDLSAAQERLLEWVATERQLALPGLLFLDPLHLERAISCSDNPGVRKRLTDLRARLFSGLVGPSHLGMGHLGLGKPT